MFYLIKRLFFKRRLDNAFFDTLKLVEEENKLLNQQVSIQDKLIKLYQNKLNQHGIKF